MKNRCPGCFGCVSAGRSRCPAHIRVSLLGRCPYQSRESLTRSRCSLTPSSGEMLPDLLPHCSICHLGLPRIDTGNAWPSTGGGPPGPAPLLIPMCHGIVGYRPATRSRSPGPEVLGTEEQSEDACVRVRLDGSEAKTGSQVLGLGSRVGWEDGRRARVRERCFSPQVLCILCSYRFGKKKNLKTLAKSEVKIIPLQPRAQQLMLYTNVLGSLHVARFPRNSHDNLGLQRVLSCPGLSWF